MEGVQIFCIFAAIFVMQSSGRPQDQEGKGRQITNIKYTVENFLTDDQFSDSIQVVQPTGSVFLKYMEDAAQKKDIFKFTCTEYPPYGCFVDDINGLAGSIPDETFWAFIRRDKDTGDCLQNVGVSTYVPQPKEHIVFSYKTYDVFNELLNCETGGVDPHA